MSRTCRGHKKCVVKRRAWEKYAEGQVGTDKRPSLAPSEFHWFGPMIGGDSEKVFHKCTPSHGSCVSFVDVDCVKK